MYRGWPRSNYQLRKAARDLLPKPAVRLLLPCLDQPAPAGKSRAGRSHHRAEQDRATAAFRQLTAVRAIDPGRRLLRRRRPNSHWLHAHGAELEFGDLSKRIERHIGEQIGNSRT